MRTVGVFEAKNRLDGTFGRSGAGRRGADYAARQACCPSRPGGGWLRPRARASCGSEHPGGRPGADAWRLAAEGTRGRRQAVSIVIDASVTLAWCFEDEQTPAAMAVLDRVTAAGAGGPQP